MSLISNMGVSTPKRFGQRSVPALRFRRAGWVVIAVVRLGYYFREVFLLSRLLRKRWIENTNKLKNHVNVSVSNMTLNEPESKPLNVSIPKQVDVENTYPSKSRRSVDVDREKERLRRDNETLVRKLNQTHLRELGEMVKRQSAEVEANSLTQLLSKSQQPSTRESRNINTRRDDFVDSRRSTRISSGRR